MTLNKIFFSYARTDASQFSSQLAVDLKRQGFNVWIDQQDIRAGMEWDLEIEKALEACDCLLFIESEKSVVSNNVLDEVYYALEQQKRVIPIIFHDSKTPFRLQRLQHIDFSQDYEKGLQQLINELKNNTAAIPLPVAHSNSPLTKAPPFFKKYLKPLLITACLLLFALVFFYITNNKTVENKTVENKTLENKTSENKEQINETPAEKQDAANAGVKETPVKLKPVIKEKIEKKLPPGRNTIIATPPAVKTINSVENTTENLHEMYAGNWELGDVVPKAASSSGYLRIEEIDEKRVKIQSSFQFYFFKSKAKAFFVVFNGFAACASCVLKNEIKITDKDIAFGSQKYETLLEDQPDGAKAGDTVMSAGGNNSIKAFVTLQLVNKNSVIIKVHQPVPTPVSNGLVVPAFEYLFRFRKSE